MALQHRSRNGLIILVICTTCIVNCHSITILGVEHSSNRLRISDREDVEHKQLLYEEPSDNPHLVFNGTMVSNSPTINFDGSEIPSAQLTSSPSKMMIPDGTNPSSSPSSSPSFQPLHTPSKNPTLKPSDIPTLIPSVAPSLRPTTQPSSAPSLKTSSRPSSLPSLTNSLSPSLVPTLEQPVEMIVDLQYKRYYLTSSSVEASDVDEDLFEFFWNDYYGSECTVHSCGRLLVSENHHRNEQWLHPFDIQSVQSQFYAIDDSCTPEIEGALCKNVETKVIVRYYPVMFSHDRTRLIVASTLAEFMTKRAIYTVAIDPVLETLRTRLTMSISGVQNVSVDYKTFAIIEDSVSEFMRGLSASIDLPIEMTRVELFHIHGDDKLFRRSLKKTKVKRRNAASFTRNRRETSHSILYVAIITEGDYLPSPLITYYADEIILAYFEQNIDHFISILQSGGDSFDGVHSVNVTLADQMLDEDLPNSDANNNTIWFIVGAIAILSLGMFIWCWKCFIDYEESSSLDKKNDINGFIVEDDCDEIRQKPLVITLGEHNRRMHLTSDERYAEARATRKIEVSSDNAFTGKIQRVQQQRQSQSIQYSYSMERFISGFDMQPTASESFDEETSDNAGYAVVGD